MSNNPDENLSSGPPTGSSKADEPSSVPPVLPVKELITVLTVPHTPMWKKQKSKKRKHFL